jgi:hypothetical protein
MPHIEVKDKGSADLYFEFMEPRERKEFFEDLTSDEKPIVSLPDFGKIDKNVNISNPVVKEIKDDDLTKNTENFIERFINDKRTPMRPFLEYNDKQHKYELKPKYDLEKLVKDISQSK